jgi:hypothetical protein
MRGKGTCRRTALRICLTLTKSLALLDSSRFYVVRCQTPGRRRGMGHDLLRRRARPPSGNTALHNPMCWVTVPWIWRGLLRPTSHSSQIPPRFFRKTNGLPSWPRRIRRLVPRHRFRSVPARVSTVRDGVGRQRQNHGRDCMLPPQRRDDCQAAQRVSQPPPWRLVWTSSGTKTRTAIEWAQSI